MTNSIEVSDIPKHETSKIKYNICFRCLHECEDTCSIIYKNIYGGNVVEPKTSEIGPICKSCRITWIQYFKEFISESINNENCIKCQNPIYLRRCSIFSSGEFIIPQSFNLCDDCIFKFIKLTSDWLKNYSETLDHEYCINHGCIMNDKNDSNETLPFLEDEQDSS